MNEAVVEPGTAPGRVLDTLRALVMSPRCLFGAIDGSQERWRDSLLLAGGAILCNTALKSAISGEVGMALWMAVYLVVMTGFYTGVLHALVYGLLEKEPALLTTSTAVNYAMVTAALLSVPYLGPVMLLGFFTLIYLALDALFGAARWRALVVVGLFVMTGLVFESAAALLGFTA